jgi:hypothetical protein
LYYQRPDCDFEFKKIITVTLSIEDVSGRPFLVSGEHYWYELRVNMALDEFYPAFLLYNSGKLNAFGWALNVNLNSSRYEHPTPSVFGVSQAFHPSSTLESYTPLF